MKKIIPIAVFTMEQLKKVISDNNLNPNITRFFVDVKYEEPKAFVIYKDGDEFIVYKNKADGSRAVRYRGTDESEAVSIFYAKLLEEWKKQAPQLFTEENRAEVYRTDEADYIIEHDSTLDVDDYKAIIAEKVKKAHEEERDKNKEMRLKREADNSLRQEQATYNTRSENLSKLVILSIAAALMFVMFTGLKKAVSESSGSFTESEVYKEAEEALKESGIREHFDEIKENEEEMLHEDDGWYYHNSLVRYRFGNKMFFYNEEENAWEFSGYYSGLNYLFYDYVADTYYFNDYYWNNFCGTDYYSGTEAGEAEAVNYYYEEDWDYYNSRFDSNSYSYDYDYDYDYDDDDDYYDYGWSYDYDSSSSWSYDSGSDWSSSWDSYDSGYSYDSYSYDSYSWDSGSTDWGSDW